MNVFKHNIQKSLVNLKYTFLSSFRFTNMNKLNTITEKSINSVKTDNIQSILNNKYKKVFDSLQEENRKAFSFKEFRFLPEIYNVLERIDISAPTSVQLSVIPKIISNDSNVFFASNTGMGKTLAYLLPIINHLKIEEINSKIKLTQAKKPRALIIVPTRELAQQVEEVAKQFIYEVPLKIKCLFVGQKFTSEKDFLETGVDILISTPERFKKHWNKQNTFITGLKFLVIDELDTLLDAGTEKSLRELVDVALKRGSMNQVNNQSCFKIIFASTTLTTAIEVWLDTLFKNTVLQNNENNQVIIENKLVKLIDKSTNHNLSNVKHQFIHVTDYDKLTILLNTLKEKYSDLKNPIVSPLTKSEKQAIKSGNASTIIFCNSIDCVRKVQYFLKDNGFQASAIHGDIPPFKRQTELYLFKSKSRQILVCTDIIARGLDFPFVYYVYNFDFPKTLSDYVHRAGRTGRAGREGLCISFFRNKDQKLIDQLKECQMTKTPLNIDKSLFSLKNKETMISTDNDTNKVSRVERIKKASISNLKPKKTPTEENIIILKREKQQKLKYKERATNQKEMRNKAFKLKSELRAKLNKK